MTRVIATEEGDWFLARVEGPRSLRTALRQSIPAAQFEHAPDGQLWRIHRNSWPTACTVFSRFEVPIVWTSQVTPGVPYGPAVPYREDPPFREAVSHAEETSRLEVLHHAETASRIEPAPAWDSEHVKAVPEVAAAAQGADVVHVETPTQLEDVLDVEIPTLGEEALLHGDVADVPAPELSVQSKEDEMQQTDIKDFTVTISGNGLTAERMVDYQTAWSILAKLFGPEATSDEGRTVNGRLAAR
jgi:hypothetical protein